MPRAEIVFYKEDDGSVPIRDWLDRQTSKGPSEVPGASGSTRGDGPRTQASRKLITSETASTSCEQRINALVHNSDRGRELAWPRLRSSRYQASGAPSWC